MASLKLQHNHVSHTSLFLRGEDLTIERTEARQGRKILFPMSVEELDTIAREWPRLKASWFPADAQPAAPATPSPNTSRASPAPASSPSSGRGSLL